MCFLTLLKKKVVNKTVSISDISNSKPCGEEVREVSFLAPEDFETIATIRERLHTLKSNKTESYNISDCNETSTLNSSLHSKVKVSSRM